MDNIVYAIRQKFRITQEELAHILGVSYTTVNAWEGGKRNPQEHMVHVLNDLLSAESLPSSVANCGMPQGISRSSAGFVSSIIDYKNARDSAPYTHKIGRWYGSLPSFFVGDLLNFIRTDYRCSGPLLANFSGSGTVALEAALSGMQSYAIDINPMSVLLSYVKTQKIAFEREEVNCAFNAVISNRDISCAAQEVSKNNLIWSENKWFSDDARKATKQICVGISKIENYYIQCLLVVALTSIITNFCNIDKRCTNHYVYRDVGVFDRKKFNADFYAEINLCCDALLELQEVEGYINPVITGGDACHLQFPDNSIGVVFSHPPYGTTINYYSINRIPLSIIESISFYNSPHIHSFECQHSDISSGTLTRFSSFTEAWVNEVYRVLDTGGVFVVVIGDSRNTGKLSHPFTDVISAGEKAGFSLKELFIWVTNHKAGMHVKRKGNHIDHNYVIIMEK